MKEISKAIGSIGSAVTVESSMGLKNGRAVISPMRYYKNRWGDVGHEPEGRTEPRRFAMFCSNGLLKDSGYGSVVYQGRDKYVLIWKDEMSSRVGSYTKACLRKVTEEESEDG